MTSGKERRIRDSRATLTCWGYTVKMTKNEARDYGVNGEQEETLFNRFVSKSEPSEVSLELR